MALFVDGGGISDLSSREPTNQLPLHQQTRGVESNIKIRKMQKGRKNKPMEKYLSEIKQETQKKRTRDQYFPIEILMR